ncbi:uncharacterized protein VTP21DRAFT_1931 [Calcarisporiella thermophila]|uniref:uncharacterized protein n=1 Tax=Calcarisporiella thermophila TaxID=911321 RepID=UPI003743FB15
MSSPLRSRRKRIVDDEEDQIVPSKISKISPRKQKRAAAPPPQNEVSRTMGMVNDVRRRRLLTKQQMQQEVVPQVEESELQQEHLLRDHKKPQTPRRRSATGTNVLKNKQSPTMQRILELPRRRREAVGSTDVENRNSLNNESREEEAESDENEDDKGAFEISDEQRERFEQLKTHFLEIDQFELAMCKGSRIGARFEVQAYGRTCWSVWAVMLVQGIGIRTMRLIIRADYDAVAEYTANYIKERIVQFNPTPERPFVLGLPTGSSPIGCYRKLVEMNKNGELSFANVVTFNMDEYVGLPREHPQSYHTFMWEHLFKHVDILPQNVHILDGNATDLDAECQQFEEKIRQAGGIELFLGGIGPDGHIAFNEPGSSLTSRTRVKTLAYETILANARFFDNDLSKVPALALTVGVGTVMDAREVVVLITGAHKSIALAKCIEDGVNHMWTVSAIQKHPKGMIVCDEDATLELHVKTVKYFKSIERVHTELIGTENVSLQGGVKGNVRRSQIPRE